MTEHVRPGQIWADNDKRAKGRTLRVELIEDGKAVCTVLTNTDKAQEDIDRHGGKSSGWFQDTRGKTRRIALTRFKPTNTGYRLIEESSAGMLR